MSEKVFLTHEGFEKLQGKLKALKGKKRREIANALESARLLGDISENAEYESAKQEQGINEGRIMELEDKFARAQIIDEKNISKDKAYVGATVKLKDTDSGEDITYKLMSEDEADFAQGKISISSPVGKALLGKKKGELVNIKIPAGVLKYKVVDISR